MSEHYQNAPSGATRADHGPPTCRADRQRRPSDPISPLAASHPPGNGATGLDGRLIASGPAHIDTLALHFWHEPPAMLSAISEINRRPAFWEHCRDANGEQRGHLFYVHQPRLEVLPVLDWWMLKYGGCTSRFDVASELIPADPTMSILDLKGWLSRNTILRWRPPGPSLEIDDNFYSVQQAARTDGRKSKRDYLIYNRPSKIDQGSRQEVCEFELRFQRSEAVRRERQIDRERVLPSDLRSLDPRQLIQKHIKFVDMDGFVANSIRESIAEDRQRQKQRKGNEPPYLDRYRTSLHNRIKSVWQRGCKGRAQTFKDHHPTAAKRLKALKDCLLVPSSLTWPDQQHAFIDNAQLNSEMASSYRIDMDQ